MFEAGRLFGVQKRTENRTELHMACSSNCPTPGSHATWGECVRAKALQVEGVEAHAYNSRVRYQQEDYADARRSGMQPDGIQAGYVKAAREFTDKTGIAYRADEPEKMTSVLLGE